MTEPSQQPYSVVMEVGPELAIKWLEGNTQNRPIHGGHVQRLAQEILADRWRLTHQGIAFDTEGLLIDGEAPAKECPDPLPRVRLRVSAA